MVDENTTTEATMRIRGLTTPQLRILAKLDEKRYDDDGWWEFTDSRSNKPIEALLAKELVWATEEHDVERGKPVMWYRAMRAQLTISHQAAIEALLELRPAFREHTIRKVVTQMELRSDVVGPNRVQLKRLVPVICITVAGRTYKVIGLEDGPHVMAISTPAEDGGQL